MRKLMYVLGVPVVAVVLGSGVGALYLQSAEPDYGQDAVLPGLASPVELWRDSLGVPHVWAESEADLFRAMGYVHAQDRLWQMELLRRVADGRLAEVLGEPLVDTDRFLRTLGIGRLAALNESVLTPDERGLLEAYAAGVNAWITERAGALPPELLLLGIDPEPWLPRHSLAVGKIMGWDLADWNLGLDLQRAVERVGPELASHLFPVYPEWGPTILETAGAVTRRSARAPVSPARTALRDVPLPRIPAAAAALLEAGSISRASNSWVIGGQRTRSGKPILANDMHLALRAPSLWYLAAIHGGAIDAVGMTIPGVPLVVAGHTPTVAWGFTNAMVDDVDFFVERVDPADPARYLTPAGPRAFEARAETIRVKGGDPVVQRVRASVHGPIVSDVDPRGGRRALAMRWTAQDPSLEVRALMGMNRSRTGAEFRAALRTFQNPHQNVVFADAAGEIGYWMSGRVPMRRNGDGVLPAAGWTGEGEWAGYLPWDDHPHALNPPAGYIVSANHRQAPADFPVHITTHWLEPFRAIRIHELLAGGSGFTARDVAAQQLDVRDLMAARHLPIAVKAATDAGDSAALRLLREWNGDATADSRAAALFYTWYERLRRKVGEDEYRGAAMYFPRDAFNRLLDAGGGAWVDDVRTPRTESLSELAEAALREAVVTVGERAWGEIHTIRIEHALGSVPAIDRALDLNIGPFPGTGSPYTVNVSHFDGREPPFVTTFGPSQRHVVDLADPDGTGGFVVPTGQSGVPRSPHYSDQAPRWRRGELWLIPLDRDKAETRTVVKMRLRPE